MLEFEFFFLTMRRSLRELTTVSSMSVAGTREIDPTDAVLDFSMQVRKRDVIAIANAGLGCMGRHHAMTGIVEQKSSQQMVARVPCLGSGGPLIRELLLDRIK